MHEDRPILLIEDEQNAAMTFRRMLGISACTCPLVHAQDKEGALLFLQERSTKPRLVVMNMDTASMSGTEFLEIVKQDPILCSVPIVGLSTNNDPVIVQHSFALGIAGYIVKAENDADLASQVAVILDYWQLNRVALVTLLDECIPLHHLNSVE